MTLIMARLWSQMRVSDEAAAYILTLILGLTNMCSKTPHDFTIPHLGSTSDCIGLYTLDTVTWGLAGQTRY